MQLIGGKYCVYTAGVWIETRPLAEDHSVVALDGNRRTQETKHWTIASQCLLSGNVEHGSGHFLNSICHQVQEVTFGASAY